MNRPDAAYWIDRLQLIGHVEGGSYREMYRSPHLIPPEGLPAGFHQKRSLSTAIYFLLEHNQFSAFHRIASDELWHFYFGDPLEIIEIDPVNGSLLITRLGANPEQGEVFQALVKAGQWFGSRVAGTGKYALVGCTVSPGFDFDDFELADRAALKSLFPQHGAVIDSLTR